MLLFLILVVARPPRTCRESLRKAEAVGSSIWGEITDDEFYLEAHRMPRIASASILQVPSRFCDFKFKLQRKKILYKLIRCVISPLVLFRDTWIRISKTWLRYWRILSKPVMQMFHQRSCYLLWKRLRLILLQIGAQMRLDKSQKIF